MIWKKNEKYLTRMLSVTIVRRKKDICKWDIIKHGEKRFVFCILAIRRVDRGGMCKCWVLKGVISVGGKRGLY